MAHETQIPRLAALIIADHPVELPLVLGRSVTELQIARVVATGARHIVCLVHQVSVRMLAVADNLRGNGLTIDIVRSITDAADAIHPEEQVFLVASQVLVSGKTLEALANKPPSLLCVENDPKYGQFELIDGSARWTGYAYLSGVTLRRVAAMIGDWDAASTLLRQMVQENARRVVLAQSQIDDSMLTVRDGADAIQAGRKLLNEDIAYRGGFGERWIAKLISQLAARIAGELGLKSLVIEYAAVAIAVGAAIISLAGWLGISMLLLLFSYLAQSTGTRLAVAVADLNSRNALFRCVITGSATVITGSCAITLTSRTGQWGCLVLGGLLVGSQALLVSRQSSVKSSARWAADPLSSIVLLFLGIVSTLPLAGLFLATAHSTASYLYLDGRKRPLLGDQE